MALVVLLGKEEAAVADSIIQAKVLVVFPMAEVAAQAVKIQTYQQRHQAENIPVKQAVTVRCQAEDVEVMQVVMEQVAAAAEMRGTLKIKIMMVM